MENIFKYLPEEELAQVVGESIQTQDVCVHDNAHICIVNNRHIVKVPVDKRASVSLLREIGICGVLQKHALSFKTPNWKYVELKTTKIQKGYPKFCAVAPVIEGTHPDTLDTPLLTFGLGAFLAELHKVPAEAFAGVALTYMDVEFNYMVDTWERQKRHENVEKTKWKQFKKYLKNTVLVRANEVYIHQQCPILTHADLHVGNVLVNDNGRLNGVLDFGNAMLGSSPQDIITAGAWLRHGNVLVNSYYGKMGARMDVDEKQQKAWKLVSQMNKCAGRMLEQFLEKQRG